MGWPDLRYAIRNLARTPGFTLVALATLALGIGANTAIFSVVRAVLLRDYPFERPAELVQVGHERPERGSVFGGFSPQDVDDLRAGTPQLSSTLGLLLCAGSRHPQPEPASVSPSNIAVAAVDGHFFATLGVSAARGRTFGKADDVPGSNRVLVVSDAFWRSRLAADPKVIGSTLQLDGQPFRSSASCPAPSRFPESGSAGLPPAARCSARTTCRTCAGFAGSTSWHGSRRASLFSRPAQVVGSCWSASPSTIPRATRDSTAPPWCPSPTFLNGSIPAALAGAARGRGTGAPHRLRQRCAPHARARPRPRPRDGDSFRPRRHRGRLLGQLLLESAVLAFVSAAAGLLLAWIGVPLLASLAADVDPARSGDQPSIPPSPASRCSPARRLPRRRHPARHSHGGAGRRYVAA